MKKILIYIISVFVIFSGVFTYFLVFNNKQAESIEINGTSSILEEVYEHYDTTVKTTRSGLIVDKDGNEIAKFGAGLFLQLAQIDGQLFQLKDTEYYVNYQDVTPDSNFNFDNRLINYVPFNKSVKAGSITAYQSDGVAVTITSTQDLVVYEKDLNKSFIYYLGMRLFVLDDQAIIIDASNQKVEIDTSVPVFMYHYFYDSRLGEKGSNGNFLDIVMFEQQMKFLVENNYHTVTMDELEKFVDGKINLPKNSVAITIDDGDVSMISKAYPVIAQYGVNATAFIITGITDNFEQYSLPTVELQSHTDSMHRGGCSGMGHGGLINCISVAEGINDLQVSSNKLGGGIHVFCYPFGDNNANSRAILEGAGYTMAFTVEPGTVEVGMDKLLLPRSRISDGNSLENFIAKASS